MSTMALLFASKTPQRKRLVAVLGATILALAIHLCVEHRTGSGLPLEQINSSARWNRRGNFAYALFLVGATGEMATGNDDDDYYFIQTRMLTYQILHDPKTRSAGYPLEILVTDDVPHSMRQRLVQDGAIVTEVAKIKSDWIKTKSPQWQDVLSKLHLFNLVQYEKVIFFDSDHYLARPVDGMFDDPAAQMMMTSMNISEAPVDEGAQPRRYLFAGNSGAGGYDHSFPQRKGDNFNSGCMVLGPSREMFDYYMRIAAVPDRFPPKYPEQNLWSYVHRRGGNMPWKQLDPLWNTNWANHDDVKNGYASLHTKFWQNDHDLPLRDLVMRKKWEMEGFWEGVDSVEVRGGI